jgi:hypothetical protein
MSYTPVPGVVREGTADVGHVLNSSFNDVHSSSERTPEAPRSSSPSVSMHLRHADRNISPSLSPSPVLQRRLAPLIIANCTPSLSPSVAETFPSEPPSPLVPSNPPPSGSSPTPPPTQILPAASFFLDSSSSYATTVLPLPSETERENQPGLVQSTQGIALGTSVPSSLRYLVWSYLTDGKASCVPGVYSQLCGRGRVPAPMNVDWDAKRYIQNQPHLQGTRGPVLVLLQAYLNMVPDI